MRFLIKKHVKGFFGYVVEEEEEGKQNSYVTNTLNTFLLSSLNVELVHIILKGITKFQKYPMRREVNKKSQKPFKMQRMITLNKIRIRNY